MSEGFLQLAGKTVLISGLANRKSVAWHVGRVLREAGATVVYSVHTRERRDSVANLVDGAEVFVCDFEDDAQIQQLAIDVAARHPRLHGIVHAVAFADYQGKMRPFHETSREAFLRTVGVSCFSFIALANAMKDLLDRDASVVTISISTTRMASENYGFMAPVKAALDSSIAFLAKSFSQFSRVRFNAVGPGLLKTASSAGIPGYVDAYLYAEQATLRKEAVKTEEVANTVAFLLSPRSSGINAQRIIIDAGMEVNYFDRALIDRQEA